MKKSKLLFILFVVLSSLSTAFAQEYQGQDQEYQQAASKKSTSKSKILKNGFSIKVSLGLPTTSYLALDGYEFDEKPLDLMVGLQIGNQWYLYKTGQFGLALNVNWFDISAGSGYIDSGSGLESEFEYFALEMSALEFGPLVSYALTDKFGLDMHYNLRPTMIVAGTVEEEGDVVSGFTHAIGGGIRYGVFSFGIEYQLGNLGLLDPVDDFEEDLKFNTNLTKINFGFKF